MTTDDEPVGSLGSEAAMLLEALQDWAAGTATGAGGAEHIATGSAACTYCPLCRVISALRDDPEVREHLSAAATSLMEAVVGMLSAGGRGPDPDAEPSEQGEEAD